MGEESFVGVAEATAKVIFVLVGVVIRGRAVEFLIFGEDKGLAAQAGERIEHAGVILRVSVELLVLEGLKDLDDGELDSGLVDFERVAIANQIGSAVAQENHLLCPTLI